MFQIIFPRMIKIHAIVQSNKILRTELLIYTIGGLGQGTQTECVGKKGYIAALNNNNNNNYNEFKGPPSLQEITYYKKYLFNSGRVYQLINRIGHKEYTT